MTRNFCLLETVKNCQENFVTYDLEFDVYGCWKWQANREIWLDVIFPNTIDFLLWFMYIFGLRYLINGNLVGRLEI